MKAAEVVPEESLMREMERTGEEEKMSYIDFLKSKMVIAPETGFDIDESEINPALLPHQRAAVKWAVKGGRRALFDFVNGVAEE